MYGSERYGHRRESLLMLTFPQLLPNWPTLSQSFSREFTTWRPLKDLRDRNDLPPAVRGPISQSQQSAGETHHCIQTFCLEGTFSGE